MKRIIRLSESDLTRIINELEDVEFMRSADKVWRNKKIESALGTYDDKFKELGVKLANVLYELKKVGKELDSFSEEIYSQLEDEDDKYSFLFLN